MKYLNKDHSALIWIGISAVLAGGLISLIASAAYSSELDAAAGQTSVALSTTSAWQAFGNGMVILGAVSFIAALVVGTIGYDFRYYAANRARQTDEENAS